MNTSKTLSTPEIWIRLLLYPSHTLPTAAAPVLVGIGLAIRDDILAPLSILIAFLGSWLIHIGGVFIDNYELLRRYPELPEHPELIQAVQNSTLKLSDLRVAIYVCFGLAALTAPYLFSVGGYPVLILGVIGIYSSLAYAGGPFPYARYGLAEPLFFLMFGVVATWGSYYIQAAAHLGPKIPELFFLSGMPLEIILLGLPVGALVTNVLIIDDIRDRHFDAEKGWRTGTVRFGLRWSRIRFSLLMALAFIAPVFLWLNMNYNIWILLPLATAPIAWGILQKVLRYDQTQQLLPMTPATSLLSLFYAMLLAIGIAMSDTSGIF